MNSLDQALEKLDQAMLVDNYSLGLKLRANGLRVESLNAKKWLGVDSTIGINHFSPRVSGFPTPWTQHTLAPELQTPYESSLTLSDLVGQRAKHYVDASVKTNKKIAVLWSGGIDSTVVLSAFIKNYNQQLNDTIVVYMSTGSVLENPYFYKHFVEPNFEVRSIHHLRLDDDFFNTHLMITGENGDSVFGHLGVEFSQLVDQGLGSEPWKKHVDKFYKIYDKPYMPGFGKWFVDHCCQDVENKKLSGIELNSVVDWSWHELMEYGWYHNILSPMVYYRYDFKSLTFAKHREEFLDSAFFNTVEFQNWSYWNCVNQIWNQGIATHKLAPKQYIFELDKNQQYLNTKKKEMQSRQFFFKGKELQNPVFYDQDFVGYSMHEPFIADAIKIRLEQYTG